MKYWIKPKDDWVLIEDTSIGYNVIEEMTNCNACHRYLSGYNGPRQALCTNCFDDNKDKNFRIRRIFSQ